MALICDSISSPDAWIHLLPRYAATDSGEENELAGWTLTIGYPYTDNPLVVLSSVNCLLPPSCQLDAWEEYIYARLSLPASADSVVLAGIIERIMIGLQGIKDTANVEVALESPM